MTVHRSARTHGLQGEGGYDGPCVRWAAKFGFAPGNVVIDLEG